MDCTENEKRCAEILEEAEEATPEDGGDSGGEATPQSLGPELTAEIREYRQKQLKIKYGVWSKQNGKWIAASDSRKWTAQIIQSWKKKK